MFPFLNLPESSRVDSKIDKKALYENAELSRAIRDRIKDDVERIVWCNRLAYDTVNIPGFCDDFEDYTEIQVIRIELRTDRHANSICDVMLASMPYPLFVLVTFKGRIQISAASVRINQNDTTRLVIGDVVRTGWIDPDNEMLRMLDVRAMMPKDLRDLHNGMMGALRNFRISDVMKTEVKLDSEDSKSTLERLDELDKQISKLITAIKKEDQFNRQVELNDKVRGLRAERQALMDNMRRYKEE